MKSISKREKILLLILAAAAVLYVYIYFLILPQIKGIKDVKANINKYNAEISTLTSSKVKNQRTQKDIDDLKKRISDATKALPQGEGNPAITYSIKQLADKSNIDIMNISFGEKADFGSENNSKEEAFNQQGSTQQASNSNTNNQKQGSNALNQIKYVPVSMQIKGTYDQIKSFFAAVENDTRLAEITSVNINAVQESSGTSMQNVPGLNLSSLNPGLQNGSQIPANMPVNPNGSNNTNVQSSNTSTSSTTNDTNSQNTNPQTNSNSTTANPSNGSTDSTSGTTSINITANNTNGNLTNSQSNNNQTQINTDILNVSLVVNYYYLDSSGKDETTYDFNNGEYGKKNLFK